MAIVYLHKRKDNLSIFYVGIGKDSRRASSKRGRNKHWQNIVNKCGYLIEITHADITWEEACSIEKYLTGFYGRYDLGLGALCNLTDGGEGGFGCIFSSERKEKISSKLKGRKYSKELCEQMSIRGKLYYKNNPEAIELNRQRAINMRQDSVYVEKLNASLKISMNKLEVKQKISIASKKSWEIVGRKERMKEIVTGRKHSDETKKMMSVQRSGKNNPNYGKVFSEKVRLNMSNAHKGHLRIQSEEEKIKRSNTMKEKWARIKNDISENNISKI